ncbi:chromosome partitioning protein ParA [Formosa sp. PL04]|uniref:chromosome partitioning protein ParA n=1 Tax=Formosa sp. PL04 TaxID=3081755 RepID=UPI0029826A47|nr:chromosome partitioning protein ParA [Formosa sp. PL04]MDW5288564.1 chromosome partitioning protein ParA [Formosa sp. PL04]
MEQNKSNNGLKVALGILLVLFLGTAFYTFDLMKSKRETETQLKEEKEAVMIDLGNMAKQYDVAISENDIANANLIEARTRIQGLMDSLQISETNVKSLWLYKQKYVNLQKEMDFLLEENGKLKAENSLLSTSLDSTRTRLNERNVFTDSLLVQNTALAEVMENAAVLSTVGLKGFGVIERSSGKLIPTERAKRADKLRVCFTVAKNSLVQAGDQELYIQVIDPKNNVLGANEQVVFGEKALNYSLISRFNYENTSLNVCEFVASKGDESFEEGRYVINVYNAKDLVSSTEFTLK